MRLRVFFIFIMALMLTACTGTESATDNPDEIFLPGAVSEKESLKVDFSMASGCYAEPFLLELTAPEGYGEIWYTTDGSDPESSSTRIKYVNPIGIESREGDENTASAVEPLLIGYEGASIDDALENVECELKAPEKEDVDKCSVIRAVAEKEKGGYTAQSGAVYFIGNMEDHIPGISESCAASGTDLALISIAIDHDSLFDYENGIYVRGKVFDDSLKAHREAVAAGKEDIDSLQPALWDANYNMRGSEWERSAYAEMLIVSSEGSVSQAFAQNCGVRTQGNAARSLRQKNLRLIAREEYGKKRFSYPLFGEDRVSVSGNTMDSYDKLVLRSGENGNLSDAKNEDALLQEMLREGGIRNTATQASRPCLVYINGEYFGLYVLTEDYCSEFFKDYYDVREEDVVMYKKGLKLKLDIGEIPANTNDESFYLKELDAFLDEHKDLSSEADYEEFCSYVDPESLMDYFASEIWLNNNDWPLTNWAMWRTKKDEGSEYGDGRWRFVLYDLDQGGFYEGRDTISEAGLLDTSSPQFAVRIFATAMTNEGFKEKFKERLLALSTDVFDASHTDEYFDRYEAVYGPLYEQHFNRYPMADGVRTKQTAIDEMETLRQFMYDRPVYIWPMQDGL